MIYLRYDFRWKDYKSLLNLRKEQKSEFEMEYAPSDIRAMNERFYSDFQKRGTYITCVTDVTDCEIVIYAAVDIQSLDALLYEEEVIALLHDCDMVKKTEVTIEEYKREISRDPYDAYSRKIFDKLCIDYRCGFFDPFPFKLDEDVLDYKTLSKSACKRRAKEILASKSFYEEIERIYAKENQKIYMGHPVHYLISAVIIELKSEDGMGQFATDFHEFTKLTGLLLEAQKKDTLFIFVEITGKSLKDNDALNNILTKADIIQITEGTGTPKEANNYLMELVKKVDFHSEDKSDVLEFLPKAESYSVTDIFNAYNAWYGSGLKNHVYKAYKEKKTFQVTVTKAESKPYEELQDMIGLAEVKAVINQVIAASKVLRVRERMGLSVESASLHMMFSGNPGTAKTTVARLLAKILKEEDAIKSGQFVECGRQDLVGKYVGWTARIVEEKFKEASGGVLFIDEAYALVDDSNTYGAEAINTITQMMENYRNDVIVIFAGYPDKMQEFLNQNEGLKSRIAFHLDFPDYTADELTKIITLMSKNREYQIEEEALAYCREIFEGAVCGENFGNGRYARNVLEQAILRQADRIVNAAAGRKISKEEICLLKREDFRIVSQNGKKEGKRMGFVS